MADPENQAELFPIPSGPEGLQVINDRCVLRTQDGRRLVIVAGIVLTHYAVGDRIAEAHARVSLVEQGWADQNDIARVFDCSARTVRRDQRRFEDGGMDALGHAAGYPAGRSRVTLAQSIERLKSDGHSNREIARRLGINERAVRKRLRRAGWTEPTPEQKALPLRSSGRGHGLTIDTTFHARTGQIFHSRLNGNHCHRFGRDSCLTPCPRLSPPLLRCAPKS